MPNNIIHISYITRKIVQNHPDWIFLFGDNWEQKGTGGQAREMRGESNAIGIPTKKAPSNHTLAFLNDDEFAENTTRIDNAIDLIPDLVTVVIPTQGIGTGLARMPRKAPITYQYLKARLRQLGEYDRHIQDVGLALAYSVAWKQLVLLCQRKLNR